EIIPRNIENDFFPPIRIDKLVLDACCPHMSVWPEPDELRILQEGDLSRRADVIAFKRRNSEILDRLFARDGSIRAIFPILRDEPFRRSRLRHRETDARPVHKVHTVCGEMHPYSDIASSRYKDAGVHRPIIFKGQTRQVAKLVAAAYGLVSRLPRFDGAADGAPEDDAFFGVCPP